MVLDVTKYHTELFYNSKIGKYINAGFFKGVIDDEMYIQKNIEHCSVDKIKLI